MKLFSESFEHNQLIPEKFAFCVVDPEEHVQMGDNLNPHLAWSDVPVGTASFALSCVDWDVPSEPDDVNQEGKTVPAALERVAFAHWLLFDIDPNSSAVEEGEWSRGVEAGGKDEPEKNGARQGLNDYTLWFEGDEDMAGNYYGYDGPCPPWNDERVHNYVFTLYALDVPSLEVGEDPSLDEMRTAIRGHVLEQSILVGRYSLNPNVLDRIR